MLRKGRKDLWGPVINIKVNGQIAFGRGLGRERTERLWVWLDVYLTKGGYLE